METMRAAQRPRLVLLTVFGLMALAVVLALSTAGAGASGTLAGHSATYTPIFADGFDGGSTVAWDLPAGWAPVEEGGEWFLRATPGGATSPGGTAATLINPLVYSTYYLRADLRLNGGKAAFWYRQSYDGEWYGSAFKGYRLEVSAGGLDLYRALGGVGETLLASDPTPFPTGEWHSVAISGTLGHLQVFLDDLRRLDHVDLTPWHAGSIALEAVGTPSDRIDFDTLYISAPGSIAPVWEQAHGPWGGFITTIEMDPANPARLYAGGGGGRVFRTSDGGGSWAPLAQIARYRSSISDLLIAPDSPQTVYALVSGDALFKSADAGETWQRLAPDGLQCAAISPQSSQQLAVCAPHVVYATADGGTTWTDLTYDLPLTETLTTVALAGPGEIWAGTTSFSTGGGGLYRLPAGALSWSAVDLGQASGTDVQHLFVDPQDLNTLYATFGNPWGTAGSPGEHRLFEIQLSAGSFSAVPLDPPDPPARPRVIGKSPADGALYVTNGLKTYHYDASSETWAEITISLWHVDPVDMAIHPTNPNLLYLPRRTVGVAKSTDGGATWFPIDQGILASSVIHLAVPNVPGSDYVYTDGYRSTNGGNSWEYYVDKGIGHPFFDEVVVNPHDPDNVWVVVDLGTIFTSTDAGASWSRGPVRVDGPGFRYGSIYAMAAAPSDSDVLYALKNGLGILKTTDRANSWKFLYRSEVDYSYSLAVHPTEPSTLYSGYSPKPFQDWAMVRQTLDGGDSWTTTLVISGSTGVTSVAIDPNQPATVYAASAGQGGRLWVTHDAGGQWDLLNERLSFTNLHTFAIDPQDPDVAYAAVWGGGTFRTADGGTTWQRLPGDPTPSASAILLDPSQPGLLYLADRTAPRLYRSPDGGTTWQVYFDAGAAYYRVMAAALAPGDPSVLYAAIFTHGGPMAGEVFRIQNGTASLVTGNLPRLPVALAVDPLDADTVYAVLHGYGVYKSTTGGGSWVSISGPASGLPQTPRVGFGGLVVSPLNPNRLYLFGGCDVDLDLSHTGADPAVMNTVYRSDDGGGTWINLDDGHLGANSGAIKGLALSPLDPGVLFVGSVNGVWRSLDLGSTWTDLSAGLAYTHTAGVGIGLDGTRLYAPTLGGGVYAGDLLTPTQTVAWDSTSHLTATIYHLQIAVDPLDSGTLYASAYPGGLFKSTDAGETWQEANFGLASFRIDDPNRQGYYALAIAPSAPDRLYLGLYGVGVYSSTDGAGTWQPANGAAQEVRGRGITALLVDSLDANVVYLATDDGLYRTDDGGGSWADFGQGLPTGDIRTLARGADGTLYAGSRGYEVYLRAPAASQWTQAAPFDNFGIIWPIWDNRPNYQFTALLFHPQDPNTLLLGTFPAGIFKSTDAGATWYERNVGWTNDGVFVLVRQPGEPEVIFAGTYNGVNRSLDGGAHWERWDSGWPAEQWVYAVQFDPQQPGVVYACSKNGENMGRGRTGFHGTVMKSTDGGAHWFPITTGLNTNQEFYELILNPFDPSTLYLATQYEGVFVSHDSGELWEPWNEGLTNSLAATNGNHVSSPMALSADGRWLYFGSSGSGAFRRPTQAPVQPVYLPLVQR